MPILIEKTGKGLKMLNAAAHFTLYMGGAIILFGDVDWGWVPALVGAVGVGISRLLIWWHHK